MSRNRIATAMLRTHPFVPQNLRRIVCAAALAGALFAPTVKAQQSQTTPPKPPPYTPPASSSTPQSGKSVPANDPQSDKPVATFTSGVKVVNVFATVRDKHGKIINDLAKDDFKITDNGHPQTIGYFARETDLPLTLGLLVDTSLSQRTVIDQERTASYKFLQQVLREDKDKAFIIHFDREVELLQDLTASRDKLENALDKLQMPAYEDVDSSGGGGGGNNGGGYPGGGGGRGGPGGGHRHGGTELYDAVYLAANEILAKPQNRKAIVVLTDGVDRGSKVSLDRAIEAAQRSNTVVYSVLFAGEHDNEGHGNRPRVSMGGGGMGGGGGWGGPGGRQQPYPRQEEPRVDGKKVLQRLSKETGGRFFEVTKKEPIDQIYADIQEELRNQYNLGYTPDKASAAYGFHKIDLTTDKKELTVQARDGYYARDLDAKDKD